MGKMRFGLKLFITILCLLAAGAGVFWWQLAADEPEVMLTDIESSSNFSSSSVKAVIPTETPPLPDDFIQTTFTPIPTLTNTPPPGATSTPSLTPTPSQTPTPTSVPQEEIELAGFNLATYVPAEATPVERIDLPRGVTNVLLLGSDTPGNADNENSVRTDTIIIASINREKQTATLLSIPRDLYVYIPGWINNRINTAYAYGTANEYPGGGAQLLKDTILYNFGIPIHYYAKIDFDGFQEVVDSLGGVEIVNSCSLRDWILKEPGLDIEVEENYVLTTLDPGVHEMDGFKALWYARSRRTTSDFDRGRRQQQLIQAILNKGLDLDLVPQIPSLIEAYEDTIETDMDIGRMLQFAAIAQTVRDNGINHLYLTQGEIEGYTTPETGASVQVLVPEIAQETFKQLYQITELNRGSRVPITAGIINRSGNPDMAILAADNLEWQGFVPVIVEDDDAETADTTTLTYHGNSFKGSYHWLAAWLFDMGRGEVELEPDATAAYDYDVVIGADYEPCRNPLYAPRP